MIETTLMEKSQKREIRTEFSLDDLPAKNVHFKTDEPIFIKNNSRNDNGIRTDLSFENCIFENVFQFDVNLNIHRYVKFINCIFKNEAIFRNTNFEHKTNFINSRFEGEVSFGNSSFKNDVNFNKSHFNQQVSFEECSFIQAVNFNETEFKGEVNFTKSTFGEKSEHKKILDNETSFYEARFMKDISFEKSLFNQNVSFQNAIFEAYLNLDNVKFNGKTRFYEAQFKGNTNFHNTIFKDLADFWNTKFSHKVIFYKTDFLGTTVLSRATFEENVLYTYSRITKLLILRGAKFKKGLDFSLSIIEGHLALFDIQIEDYQCKEVDDEDVFENIKTIQTLPEDEKFEKKYEYLITQIAEIPKKNKRETFRILKNRLLQQGNSIDYLKYARLEQKTYKSQLLEKLSLSSILSKNQYFKAFFDFVILKLNEISNNHGQSYARGIIFIFGFGLLIFYFSILATENYSFSLQGIAFHENVKYFFEFMNPVHNFDYLKEENPTPWNYVLDFFGRIVVSYGFYQTIQAFRKFKK